MRARRTAWLVLVAAVSVLHLALLPRLLPAQLGEGAAADARPQRLAVSFVSTLQPAAPPAPRTRALRRGPAAAQAVAPLPAASAAADGEPEATAALPELAPLPAMAELAPPPLPAASAAAPDATAFDWPPSTRLSYRVTGDVRGPVEGHAQVEWLRQGLRYQVHLDLGVALLASRRVSSDGVITPAGLAPRRYDEETRIALREPRRVVVALAPDSVTLADGRVLPRPEGVQDSASQFVQMTWLFNARPELLQPGQSIRFPLVLPRRLEEWVYDVVGPATVSTPAGELATVHVRPRREAGRGDLTAELWVAPSLQHLPVRLQIRQGPLVLDLLLERLPEQAAPGR